MRTKVAKGFFNPGHPETQTYFYLTKTKIIEETVQGTMPLTGRSFIL